MSKSSRKSKRKKATLRDYVRRGIKSNLQQQECIIKNRLNATETNQQNPIVLPSGSVKLRFWAIKHNITRNALCDLLKILISFGLTWLPSDARTLLHTPQRTSLINISNGQSWYNGIEKNLRRIFENLDRNMKLSLNFNVDGLPLFKSAKKEFWPILANIHGN